ncbi:MAG: FAD-dependent oxidoreductase [Bdellovibrionales bacterium GWB1_52_6]|nr:MAG: FAD-dependent oxidoreductase [Bdellovibrionales bacterium GWB1_52_6]OFZ04817.1 MAG: FAD-dependent oxidoreductase [Bdellovibrionales bacterium GWA1_52_35]
MFTCANTTESRSTNPDRRASVAVFGAGIAGLSAAHELAQLGYAVELYEATAEPGGFFRSSRRPENGNTPSEYSWHGMGPWYHNTFDLLRRIPFDSGGTVYARALSRSIDFGIFPEAGVAHFYDHKIFNIRKMFSMSHRDWIRWCWLMLKAWAANVRSESVYSAQSAAEYWRRVLSKRSYLLWRSCFGPWIGSDWKQVSVHTAGRFFCKLFLSKPAHVHAADQEGGEWKHQGGDGWLLFRGPSSEYWFERWVHFLKQKGVAVFFEAPLQRLVYSGSRISAAKTADGKLIHADAFIVATDPFSAAKIMGLSPGLEESRESKLLRSLVQDGPHSQVSFRIAFSEPIHFPRKRTAVVVADSEFNLTLFAQEQVWDEQVDLGENVKSLWTGTSCVSTVPGRIHGLPVSLCSKEQFIEEIRAQILSCQSLDHEIKKANRGRSLASFAILKIEVWHEWQFGPEGIKGLNPKWVNNTRNQEYRPHQATSVPNLFFAGAHTKTAADVWSIEGAVESGRRAAQALDPRVEVKEQYRPLWLKILGTLDDICHRANLPHFLDVLMWGLISVITLVAISLWQLSWRMG